MKTVEEYQAMPKRELHAIVGALCGVHVSMFSKKQLRRTRRELAEVIVKIESTRQ